MAQRRGNRIYTITDVDETGGGSVQYMEIEKQLTAEAEVPRPIPKRRRKTAASQAAAGSAGEPTQP